VVLAAEVEAEAVEAGAVEVEVEVGAAEGGHCQSFQWRALPVETQGE
jgi:hypothetical protein